jgi:hypothetical protein
VILVVQEINVTNASRPPCSGTPGELTSVSDETPSGYEALQGHSNGRGGGDWRIRTIYADEHALKSCLAATILKFVATATNYVEYKVAQRSATG